MQRLADITEEVRCVGNSHRQLVRRTVERQPLTDEEQSLLFLRRVRLPTTESHVRECARHLLMKRNTYVWTRLV